VYLKRIRRIVFADTGQLLRGWGGENGLLEQKGGRADSAILREKKMNTLFPADQKKGTAHRTKTTNGDKKSALTEMGGKETLCLLEGAKKKRRPSYEKGVATRRKRECIEGGLH